MFFLFSTKIKFLLRSIGYFLPSCSNISDYALKHYLKFEFSMLFLNRDYFIYSLNKNRKIKLYKNSFLTKLLLNDFEYEELAFIKQLLKEDDIVIDIGANIGLYSLLCSDYIGNNGVVYAFEAMDSTCQQLQENIVINDINNIVINNVAVSNWSNEKLTMYKHPNGYDAFDSLVAPLMETAAKITVSTISLDDFIAQDNVDESIIKLVKIDVEGWEFNVLQGAKKLIEKQLPIAFLVEFSKSDNAENISKNELVYNLLKSYDYDWFAYHVPRRKLLAFDFNAITKSCNLIAVNENFKQINSYFFQ